MIELIVGGARSGKSAYALQTAEGINGQHYFIATATAQDEEMTERIHRHQTDRSSRWQLVEEPLYLADTIARYRKGDVLLVDCLTLWLSNWLCSKEKNQWKNEQQRFLTLLNDSECSIFLVTNEVGMGVIPMDKLGREFVDCSGWLHQAIGQIADKITLVMFGVPTSIK